MLLRGGILGVDLVHEIAKAYLSPGERKDDMDGDDTQADDGRAGEEGNSGRGGGKDEHVDGRGRGRRGDGGRTAASRVSIPL